MAGEGIRSIMGPQVDAPMPQPGQQRQQGPQPLDDTDAHVLRQVPMAGGLPPAFRQAIEHVGMSAIQGGLQQMNNQQALLWTHDILHNGIRVGQGRDAALYHARAGETHGQMFKRLSKETGLTRAQMEPIMFYSGVPIAYDQGMMIGKAMGEVIKRVRKK